jgi:DNA polymerase-3 subunit delta
VSKRPRRQADGLSYDQFRRQVKEGRLDALYLFKGEEDYYHTRALRLLYSTIDEGVRSFNVSVFSLSAGGAAAEAIDLANTLPIASPRRVVVLRDFDKIKDTETELLVEYLKRPATSSVVVFQAPSLDQRRKITAAVVKVCTHVAFERLGEREAEKWAQQYLKRHGCTIEPGALGHLIGLLGTPLTRLAGELDKLATFAGGGVINSAAIDELVPREREHSSFELWDAILGRDRKKALRLAHRLLDDGIEPVVIVGTLAGLYRRLLIGKELITRGAASWEVMKATGQYGQRANVFNTRVNGTPRGEIVHGIRRIALADNAIKNSEGGGRLQIEYLVAELTLPESADWGIFT